MDKVPEISVVMAAHNEAADIAKAIESIIQQTFTNWELVLIDDGSTDETLEICQSFARLDSRIRLFVNKTNLGLPCSLNRGISLARAELLARADGDDINLPTRFGKQYLYMQCHPDVDVLGTGAYFCDRDRVRGRPILLPATHDELAKLPFLQTPLFHPSVLVRRRFFERVGLYATSYPRAEDLELWLRGFQMGAVYANLDEALIEYYTDGFIRGWRSIYSYNRSLYHLTRVYEVEYGLAYVVRSTAVAVLTKLRLFKSRTIRKGVSWPSWWFFK